MSETIKFSKDELEKIKEIQQKYFDLQTQLGQSAISKLRLAQQIESLNKHEESLSSQYSDIQNFEQDFMKKMTEKYGEGTLNPQTGEYYKK
jgi:predicted transcriptional regulator